MEVLKIIILACQVNAGGEKAMGDYMHKLVDKYQMKCQNELIKCVDSKKDIDILNNHVKDCLLKRK